MTRIQQLGHLKTISASINLADGMPAEVRLNERLFVIARLEAGGKDFIEDLNPHSLKVLNTFVEPSLAESKADDKFQFEQHGYFVADQADHTTGKLAFNSTVGSKDS